MTNEELDRLEALAKGATRFVTDGREDADDGSIEWQSMSETTFATYERKADRDWYRDAPDVVLRLVAELRSERTERARLRACLNEEATFHGRALAERDDIREERDRLAAELTEARATISRVAAKLGVDFDGAQSSKPLEDSIDEMIDSAAELSEARAEIERLRAMVPSDAEIDAMVWFVDEHDGYGTAKKLDGYLRRIESAKENGR